MKTLTKNPTHIAQVRNYNLTINEEVQRILGWSHDRYCQHQFLQYELFAKLDFCNYKPLIDTLRHSSVFRGFFNNEWNRRNEEDFLPFATDCDLDPCDIMEEYQYIHSPTRLLNDFGFVRRYEAVLTIVLKECV